MLVGQLLLAKHWDSNNKLDTSLEEIKALPYLIEEALKCEDQVKEISKLIYKKKDIYFIGRGLDYALAAENLDWFLDYSHFNEYGAKTISSQLADELKAIIVQEP